MGSLVYIRLIGYTAGTLLQLFWMVVILGYRRQRNFERVFFFLCMALFLFFGGSLLALNSQIYYPNPPTGLSEFAIAVVGVGLCLLPAMLLHVHVEFAETRGLIEKRWRKWATLGLAYLPLPYFLAQLWPMISAPRGFNFILPLKSFGLFFGLWIYAALAVCGGLEVQFARHAAEKPESRFHRFLSGLLVAVAIGLFQLHTYPSWSASRQEAIGTALALLPILPLTVLIYFVHSHNFLQIGRQKNLLYAVSATFVALLYLSLVRRVSVWLEPSLPPEASASILLFVLVVFIEPLQRTLGRMLRETAQRELEIVQRVAQEILDEAKHGDLPRLVEYAEERITKSFELSLVKLSLGDQAIAGVKIGNGDSFSAAGLAWKPPYFSILRGDALLGVLRAEPHGAALSGETRAALEFLCEQLPGALDLCRLIEEKLLLERELAERERLAVLGQMAASISHNLKNPLGSIKTILQLQMESAELPAALRGETRMVLDEVNRLSATLNQLLKFSRPTVLGDGDAAFCDARGVLEEVLGVLRHEAERRGVKIHNKVTERVIEVAASKETVHDILSNLILNALEAAPREGFVEIQMRAADGMCGILIDDNGSGISRELQQKILEPFFTTKTQGTGLGLTIVARRITEAGGALKFNSPRENGRGTRCVASLRLKEVTK
jgi:signal transduction histidine kinase